MIISDLVSLWDTVLDQAFQINIQASFLVLNAVELCTEHFNSIDCSSSASTKRRFRRLGAFSVR